MPSPSQPPSPAYVADADSVLRVDAEVLQAAGGGARRTLVEEADHPGASGRALAIPGTPRVSVHAPLRGRTGTGPQPVESPRPAERFWAARTRKFYGATATGRPAWSDTALPASAGHGRRRHARDGIDEDGAGRDDLLGNGGEPVMSGSFSPESAMSSIADLDLTWSRCSVGLTEFDVHDVLNVFQVTRLMPGDERYFMKTCPARVGDYFELFAEVEYYGGIDCSGRHLLGVHRGALVLGPSQTAIQSVWKIFRLADGEPAGWRNRRSGYRGRRLGRPALRLAGS